MSTQSTERPIRATDDEAAFTAETAASPWQILNKQYRKKLCKILGLDCSDCKECTDERVKPDLSAALQRQDEAGKEIKGRFAKVNCWYEEEMLNLRRQPQQGQGKGTFNQFEAIVALCVMEMDDL